MTASPTFLSTLCDADLAALAERWSERSYRRDGLLIRPNAVDKEDTSTVFGGVRMDVGKRTSLSVDGSREVRDTDDPIFDYTAYRAGVTATTTF